MIIMIIDLTVCICIENCLQCVKLSKNVSKYCNKTCHTSQLSQYHTIIASHDYC